MWTLQTSSPSESIVAAQVYDGNGSMTFVAVVSAWSTNPLFRDWWSRSLSAISYAAFCWETPPLTNATMKKPFECVFVESPGLIHTKAERAPFAEHFGANASDGAVQFKSLGGDATLVAPCP